MAPYQEAFLKGSRVRVASRPELEVFKRDWKFHNKLQDEQLECASQVFTVMNVFFYHGGDVLYELADAPGIWHEQCLAKVS
jgi:hypothetical protein